MDTGRAPEQARVFREGLGRAHEAPSQRPGDPNEIQLETSLTVPLRARRCKLQTATGSFTGPDGAHDPARRGGPAIEAILEAGIHQGHLATVPDRLARGGHARRWRGEGEERLGMLGPDRGGKAPSAARPGGRCGRRGSSTRAPSAPSRRAGAHARRRARAPGRRPTSKSSRPPPGKTADSA